jgi:signal transduction histidine kinase
MNKAFSTASAEAFLRINAIMRPHTTVVGLGRNSPQCAKKPTAPSSGAFFEVVEAGEDHVVDGGRKDVAREGRRRGKRDSFGCPRNAQRSRWPIILTVMAVFAILFVAADIVERQMLPALSTGFRHLLLTLRAAAVTAAASIIVYLFMQRQQTLLSRTAEQIAGLLEAYDSSSSSKLRFGNAQRVHCREVLRCKRTDCPMYNLPGERCWQHIGLGRVSRGEGTTIIDIHHCHECEVYRRACPDTLTRLGESFNNLMFLLEQEAAEVGRYRNQLLEKEKMVAVGRMAAGIAHEVGNPLSSISSIVQRVKRRQNNEMLGEQLDLINTHINRISHTVRQLSNLARPAPTNWERVDIGRILEEVVSLVVFDGRASNASVEFVRHEGLSSTFVLRDQLLQVFINLALNAFDAMPTHGRLSISTAQINGTIVIDFKDNGCGISAETGRRVFEPFFTTKEPGRGTGLGLSVSYGIIQKHGGRIEMESQEGEGSTFTVKLPVLHKDPDRENGKAQNPARR